MNTIISSMNFRTGLSVAKLYYRKTGLKLKFVPMYICPAFKSVYFCAPVEFNPEAPIESERERISGLLMDEISEKAFSLPEHTVIPYPNIGRKSYKKNTRN